MRESKLIIQYVKTKSSYSDSDKFRIVSLYTERGRLESRILEKVSREFGFSEKFRGVSSLSFDNLGEFQRYLDFLMDHFDLRSISLLDIKKFHQAYIESDVDIIDICFQKDMLEKYSNKKSKGILNRVFSF